MPFKDTRQIFIPEKYDAESWVNVGRWLAVLAASVFIFISPELTHGAPWISWMLVASGYIYNIAVSYFLIRRPNYPKFLPQVLSMFDLLFISLFVLITGGFDSTFFYLFYMYIASVALRYNLAKTTLAAIFSALVYILIVFYVGTETKHFFVELASRIMFFFFTAVFTGYISERGTKSDIYLASLSGISQLSQNFTNLNRMVKNVMETTLGFLGFEVRILAILDLKTKNQCWKIKKCREVGCSAHGKTGQKCWIALRINEGLEGGESAGIHARQCLRCQVFYKERLSLTYFAGIEDEKLVRASLPVSKVPLLSAIRSEEKLVSRLIAEENEKAYFFDLKGFKNSVFVPLFTNREVIGLIILASKTKRTLNEDEKKMIRSIASNLSMVIENIRLYNETLKSAQSIRTIQRYYQSFLEDVPMGVCLVDGDENVLVFNQTASEICRIPADKVRNHKLEDLQALKNPFLKQLLGIFFISRRKKNLMLRGELRISERKEESIVGYTYSRLKSSGGESIGAALVFQDLTGIKAMEKQLFEKQRLALLGQLVAQVAHDIRNPLNVIQMFTELMEPDLPAELRSNADIIIDQINLCNKRITKLLNFSRTSISEDQFEVISVNKIVEESLSQLSLPEGKDKIVVETELEPEELYMEGFSDGLRRVIINLLDNAVEAMPNGGKLTVSLKRKKPDEAFLYIRDTGSGMDPEIKKRIFEPFFTTKKDGTGLGLAIVNSIIFDLRGKLELSSKVGKGTEFLIKLPVFSTVPVEGDFFKKEKVKER